MDELRLEEFTQLLKVKVTQVLVGEPIQNKAGSQSTNLITMILGVQIPNFISDERNLTLF